MDGLDRYAIMIRDILKRIGQTGVVNNKITDRVLQGIFPSEATVSYPEHGFGMTVRPGKMTGRSLYFKTYEPDLVNLLQRELEPGDTFVDIGAHVGFFSLVAATLIHDTGKIYSFEPLPENYDLLNRNLYQNSIEQAVTEDVLVGRKSGGGKLYLSPNNPGGGTPNYSEARGHAMFDPDKYINKKVISADDYFEQESRIDFVKIDVQGGEFDVLKGMNRILSEQSPELVVEIHKHALNNEDISPNVLFDFLTKLDYKPYAVSDNKKQNRIQAADISDSTPVYFTP